jgi:hypothetical protein
MIDDKTLSRTRLTWGDRAASSLLRGLLAGVLMAGVLVPAGVIAGEPWMQALNVFNPSSQVAPLQGLLLHLGVSAVYGVLFGLLQPLIPRRLPGWLTGLGYGLLLFAVAELFLLPQARSGMSTLPALALLLGHGVYGLVLGLHR